VTHRWWSRHLAVFVRAALRTSAHSVRSAVSATGLGGVVGNKGGLAISFHLGTTSLAFVSCHLAAHDHKNRERNEMCKEILSETAGAIGEQRRAARGRLDVASQFDHCFWFGDLNYRVDLKLGQQAAGLPAEALKEHEAHHAAVRDLVEEEDWEALWEADQLRHSQRAGDVLARFSEGQYSFPPTFKVLRQRGAHYKQQRIPSYCDRILWRSMPGRGSSAVTQTSLAAVPGALPPARTLAPAAKPRQCRCCEQASPPRTTSPSSPLSRWPLRRGCTAPPARAARSTRRPQPRAPGSAPSPCKASSPPT